MEKINRTQILFSSLFWIAKLNFFYALYAGVHMHGPQFNVISFHVFAVSLWFDLSDISSTIVPSQLGQRLICVGLLKFDSNCNAYSMKWCTMYGLRIDTMELE